MIEEANCCDCCTLLLQCYAECVETSPRRVVKSSRQIVMKP